MLFTHDIYWSALPGMDIQVVSNTLLSIIAFQTASYRSHYGPVWEFNQKDVCSDLQLFYIRKYENTEKMSKETEEEIAKQRLGNKEW